MKSGACKRSTGFFMPALLMCLHFCTKTIQTTQKCICRNLKLIFTQQAIKHIKILNQILIFKITTKTNIGTANAITLGQE
ncbi:hypothetical protein LZ24_02626 [Desulfobotulus alkaliphilus]|uniref:Uncharacterized protein n=1 Tax=Desulfobotulus alkaliphilus TaxID=622671 RepID=A0A562RI10_9BACT|nr:hypothetical protein LZ24_02626 [Desulfobotulus alkaliphilus]